MTYDTIAGLCLPNRLTTVLEEVFSAKFFSPCSSSFTTTTNHHHPSVYIFWEAHFLPHCSQPSCCDSRLPAHRGWMSCQCRCLLCALLCTIAPTPGSRFVDSCSIAVGTVTVVRPASPSRVHPVRCPLISFHLPSYERFKLVRGRPWAASSYETWLTADLVALLQTVQCNLKIYPPSLSCTSSNPAPRFRTCST